MAPLAVLVAAFTLALPVWATASLETMTKTLQRDQDPVIVRTGRLTALRDHDTARYRLYAIRHGHLEPIPFQFDARGADGELLLSEDGARAISASATTTSSSSWRRTRAIVPRTTSCRPVSERGRQFERARVELRNFLQR